MAHIMHFVKLHLQTGNFTSLYILTKKRAAKLDLRSFATRSKVIISVFFKKVKQKFQL